MAALDTIIARAIAERGYVEAPVNRTKYGVWYSMNSQPWCAIFISWLFRDALTLIGGKHAYTPWFAQWFIAQGQWGYQPRLGAIVFFDFPDNLNRIQHVGIVTAYTATTITTIEGNTSSGTIGSQSNGGGVYKRTRPRTSSIAGYGYPKYEEVEPVAETEYYQEVGIHVRAPEHPDYSQSDAEAIAAVEAVGRKYKKAVMKRAVPKMAYKDGQQ